MVLKTMGNTVAVKNIAAFLPVVGSLMAVGVGYKMTTAFGEQYHAEARALARQLLDRMIHE